MSGTKNKSRLSQINPLERERISSVGKMLAKSAVDEAGETGRTFIEQLLGMDLKKDTTDVKAESAEPAQSGLIEIFNFLKHSDTATSQKANTERSPRARAEAAIDYHRDIVKNRERASKNETREMQQNIEQIKIELSKLVASSQVLKLEFAEVSVEQSPTEVGNYQLNFYEWMLAVIRSAREKVEDSGAWLGTVKGKGDKRGYWGMFKKHGTTFGLSGERAVATQVG